jgi:hypothetical protein
MGPALSNAGLDKAGKNNKGLKNKEDDLSSA